MRNISKVDPEVMAALARQRDAEYARAREQRWRLEEWKQQRLTAVQLKKQVQEANVELRKRRLEVLNLECELSEKHAIKSFSLEELGHGCRRGGAAPHKKRRLEVLTRLARLGQGLSAAQKNDYTWWKTAWDSQMLEEHGEDWPQNFAGWVQKILNDHEAGIANAFSLFVHDETRRCFDRAPALRVP